MRSWRWCMLLFDFYCWWLESIGDKIKTWNQIQARFQNLSKAGLLLFWICSVSLIKSFWDIWVIWFVRYEKFSATVTWSVKYIHMQSVLMRKKKHTHRERDDTHHITVWCPGHYIPFDCYVSIWIQWVVCSCNHDNKARQKMNIDQDLMSWKTVKKIHFSSLLSRERSLESIPAWGTIMKTRAIKNMNFISANKERCRDW